MSDFVPSPCTNVCRIDPRTGLCAGCLRTLEEIVGWGRYTAEEKRSVVRVLEARRKASRPGSGS